MFRTIALFLWLGLLWFSNVVNGVLQLYMSFLVVMDTFDIPRCHFFDQENALISKRIEGESINLLDFSTNFSQSTCLYDSTRTCNAKFTLL